MKNEQISTVLTEIQVDLKYIKEGHNEIKDDIKAIKSRLESGSKKIEKNWNWLRASMIAIGFLYAIVLAYATQIF